MQAFPQARRAADDAICSDSLSRHAVCWIWQRTLLWRRGEADRCFGERLRHASRVGLPHFGETPRTEAGDGKSQNGHHSLTDEIERPAAQEARRATKFVSLQTVAKA